MTAAEAIQKEIEREEQLLKGLEAKAEKQSKEMVEAIDDDVKRLALTRKLRDTLQRLIDGQNEIEGKKLALAAVKAKPDDPVGAIDAEYDAEHKKADELGRKAQALREKMFLDHPYSKDPPPPETAAELKKLSDEFDAELAKLRGKSFARTAVSAALKGG